MADDKLHIKLHVYDTDISVNIKRDDEEYYRRAAKLITETVNTYSDVFKGRKTKEDILYMSLIDIALRHEKQISRNDTAPFSNILDKLTKEIEEML